MAIRGKAGVGGSIRRASPLTAQANTSEVIAATFNVEFRVVWIARWRNVARWGWFNLQTVTAFGDPHTKAGSSVCGLRR
jgi:hypothetical protein